MADDETLARLMSRILKSPGTFVEEDIDAEINRRLLAELDAEKRDGGKGEHGSN